MSGMSYVECTNWKEVENFCNKYNLTYIEGKVYFNGIAKAVNENGCQMAYLVSREDASVSSLKEDTKWIWVLE